MLVFLFVVSDDLIETKEQNVPRSRSSFFVGKRKLNFFFINILFFLSSFVSSPMNKRKQIL